MSSQIARRTIPLMDLGRQHRPLRAEIIEAFERVLGSSAFILGEEVERFEQEFAEYCGARHCVGVNSGTAALGIALSAAGIGPGDEVIVPAHTFIATALAVEHAGATPVCADVDRGTGLLDPRAASAAIGPRTAAILPVHLYGQLCAMDELRNLARRHGLALLEDAAQAHGARDVSRLGDATAFSFYPSKNLGAVGDAGAIVTDDVELASHARRLRDLGRLDGPRHLSGGYNERLDGLQAAALRIKLRHLDGWNAARRALAARYACCRARRHGRAARGARRLRLSPLSDAGRRPGRAGPAPRGGGIGSGVHYPLALPEPPALPALHAHDAPVARDWAARELSLPMFPELTADEVSAVGEAVTRLT